MTTATDTVTGTICGHGVGAATTEVVAVEGVTAVEVDLASGRATITSDTALDRDTVAPL